MTSPGVSQRRIRFGAFEADFASGELRKHGLRVRLQEQPLQLLRLLIDRAGEVVTRTELREALWSTDTFVGFDHGLNNAINRLREALGDSADNPRFIETVPRHGYRFIAPVSTVPEASDAVAEQEFAPIGVVETEPLRAKAGQTGKPIRRLAALLLFAALVAGLALTVLRVRHPVAAASIKSLVVLPLENLTGDPAQEYFVDGMTDALITDLARIGSLRVISRTSTMHYKGARKPLPEIGRELNVDAVVEGTVARSGNRVRISAQLIQAATDRHLWADAYERDLGDILMLQNEVAWAIASQVQAKVLPEERARLTGARPVNRQAYEDYLRGHYFLKKWSSEGLEKAKEYFQQSISLDPTYAPAYVGLADYYGIVAFTARLPAQENWLKEEEILTKALKLDDKLAEAHALLGIHRLLFRCDPTGAETELNRALALSPDDTAVLDWHSYYLLETGRTDEAIAEKKRVLDRDPLSTNTNAQLGLYYVYARRSDEAIQQLQRALELDPNHAPAYVRLGTAYAYKHQYDRAIAAFQKAISLDKTPAFVARLGNLYVRSGRRREAREVIRQLKEMSKQRYVSPTLVAAVYARLGEKDDALRWLEKGREDDEPHISDPVFDSLRSDARFRAREARLQPMCGVLRNDTVLFP